jgi:periplasmic copper chaperone A
MNKKLLYTTAVAVAALPASAQAHISLHPNVLPQDSQPTVTLRVPSEEASADTVKVAVKMPPGVLDAAPAAVPGWTITLKHQKLAQPVKTNDVTITEEVSEIDLTGGHIKPGEIGLFPIALSVPGKAGTVQAFKAVQTYSNGKVVRWIGPADSDSPAPTVDVVSPSSPVYDVSGDAGPPASLPASLSSNASPKPAAGTQTSSSSSSKGASKGLGIAALVVAIVALLLAGAGVATRRRVVA